MKDWQLHGLIGNKNLIKSMQSGLTAITFGNYSVDVSINSVDLSKSIILLTFYCTGSVSYAQDVFVYGQFVNNTKIRLNRPSTPGEVRVSWKVIEFDNIKSLQTGFFSSSTNPFNVAVTSVNVAKSHLFYSYGVNDTSSIMPRWFLRGYINSATQIVFDYDPGAQATTHTCQWFLVEFN